MIGMDPIRTTLVALAALTASAALAPAAHAGILTKTATNCTDPVLSQPFKPYGDASTYKPVDGGTFENGTAGWTLTGGAKVVAGNETAYANGRGDDQSLSLPAGSSATTPPVCVGLSEPTLRFFARKNSGLLSVMTVSVEVQLQLGVWVTLPIGVDLGGAWHPSLPMLVIANVLPLLPPDQTAVRFKFAPILGGAWQVDDVFVDPRMRT
jgi:hypothetical protein